MFSNLMKSIFIGCIVIAASVPAEAGLFDRIRNRNGGRNAGCCQPQVACAPAPCAPAPCACAAYANAPSCPCSTAPSCLQLYHENLTLCKKVFANDHQRCMECRDLAARAYCECKNAPSSTRMDYAMKLMKVPCAAQPTEPTVDACDEARRECESGGASLNCATCWFECLKLIPSVKPPIETR